MKDSSAATGAASRTHLVLAAVLAATVACLGWTTWSAHRMVADFVPQAAALVHVRLDVTEAHLWLEEIVSGDAGESPQQVYDLLARADATLLALREGGEVAGMDIVALADAGLAAEVDGQRDALAAFRRLAQERMEGGDGGVGSGLDQRFDTAFSDLLQRSTVAEEGLRGEIDDARHLFVLVQLLLMAGVTLLFGWVWHLLRRKEQLQRDQHLQAQQEAYERLAASQRVLERQNNLRGALVALERALQGMEDPSRAAATLLGRLCEQTGAQVGTAWLCRRGRGLRRLAGYALPATEQAIEHLADGEGLAGEAARSGTVLRVDVPGHYLPVTSGTGGVSPARIEIHPLLHEGEAVAVFEFGFLAQPSPEALELLAAALDAAAMRFYLYAREERHFAAA